MHGSYKQAILTILKLLINTYSSEIFELSKLKEIDERILKVSVSKSRGRSWIVGCYIKTLTSISVYTEISN